MYTFSGRFGPVTPAAWIQRNRLSLLHPQLVGQLQEKFPGCRVCGHRDLSPDLNGNGEIEPEEWIKQCPCFEVAKEFNEFGAFADRTDETGSTEKHRVTQHIKKQKGGK